MIPMAGSLIFISYTQDLSAEADTICEELRRSLPNTDTYSWESEPLAPGLGLSDLKEKVNEARVFIALMSERYKEGIAAKELDWFLELLKKERLYFAPFLFSQNAQKWWNDVKEAQDAPEQLKDMFEARLYRGNAKIPFFSQIQGSSKSILSNEVQGHLNALTNTLRQLFVLKGDGDTVPRP